MAVVHQRFTVLGHVTVLVLGRVLIQRAPGAQVVPAKVHRLDIDIWGFLHDGKVDADAGTGLEIGLDVFPFLIGAEVGFAVFKDGIYVGRIGVEGIDDVVGSPEEHT